MPYPVPARFASPFPMTNALRINTLALVARAHRSR
jgi:hypothetical protein